MQADSGTVPRGPSPTGRTLRSIRWRVQSSSGWIALAVIQDAVEICDVLAHLVRTGHVSDRKLACRVHHSGTMARTHDAGPHGGMCPLRLPGRLTAPGDLRAGTADGVIVGHHGVTAE